MTTAAPDAKAPVASVQAVSLSIATYNIYNLTARYLERCGLLTRTIEGLGVDVLACQEVAFPEQVRLIEECGFSTVLTARIDQSILGGAADPTFRIDGIATAIKLCPWTAIPDSHEMLELSPERVCQRVTLKHSGGARVVVANTHLHWSTNPLGVSSQADAAIRGNQLRMCLDWLNKDCTLPTVFVGDFNSFFPDEPIFALFSQHSFVSAHKVRHGEDVVTVPTRLKAGTIDLDSVVEQKADLIMLRAAAASSIRVKECRLEEGAAQDDMAASDHFAVIAELIIHL